jgi:hypothetical protein
MTPIIITLVAFIIITAVGLYVTNRHCDTYENIWGAMIVGGAGGTVITLLVIIGKFLVDVYTLLV